MKKIKILFCVLSCVSILNLSKATRIDIKVPGAWHRGVPIIVYSYISLNA